jgi:hypothetical protein
MERIDSHKWTTIGPSIQDCVVLGQWIIRCGLKDADAFHQFCICASNIYHKTECSKAIAHF